MKQRKRPMVANTPLELRKEIGLLASLYRARRGDTNAVQEVIDYFTPEVIAMIHGHNIHPNDHHDVAQEAVIAIMDCIQSRQRKFVHYVRVVLHRRIIGYYRGAENHKPLDVEPLQEQDCERQDVDDMLSTLPREQRQLVEAYFWKDQTITEIAARQRQHPSTVKKNLEESLTTLARKCQ